MPLQHYDYEEVGSSNQFTQKVNIQNFIKFKKIMQFKKLKEKLQQKINVDSKIKNKKLKSGTPIKSKRDELILSIPNFETRINKELYLNDKEILISENKIKNLKDGKFVH
jgi:hypothetical protein